MSVEEIHNRLLALAEERGFSKYELSRRAGLKECTVYNMVARKTMPRIDTLERLCAAMDVTLSDFFMFVSEPKSQGYLSEMDTELLGISRRLSDRNMQHLLVYATGLMNGQTTEN